MCARPLTIATATTSDEEWLAGQVNALTVERVLKTVSDWASEHRYLPSDLTTMPGKFDPMRTPYWVEPMNRLSAKDPCRQLAIMKGVQIGATTCVLENALGYIIDHVPGPAMFISADADLAKMGMELRIDRMLESSGLAHKVRAGSKKPGRPGRSGDTATQKEFPGGFLLGLGGRSPGKIRSNSIKYMLVDEVDALPAMLGGVGREEGSTVDVIEGRTAAFEMTRKILWISTPLVLQTSVIFEQFERGDQRKFFVPCVECGEFQYLEWHGVLECGTEYGIVFELDAHENLNPDSVGYRCKHCEFIMRDHHKAQFLKRGEWEATAQAKEPFFYSYHVPSLLSPPGMQSWTTAALKWLRAWDVVRDRPRDIDKYRTFRNLVEGLPWEERGDSPKFETVVSHRRAIYTMGEVPNVKAVEETGAPVILLTAAADVHKDRIDVEVKGWGVDRQTYSIEWLHFDGDTDILDESGPWEELRQLLDATWTADDGREYRIITTLIDAQWRADTVHEFCHEYAAGVYPIQGRETSTKNARYKEFSEFESKFGGIGWNVNTTLYKDRIAAWLKYDWASQKLQPPGYMNFPNDYGDDFFRQYEGEHRVRKHDVTTNRTLGFFWQKIGSRDNHAWDCAVYNAAAYDMIVLDHCSQVLGIEGIDYAAFREYATPRKTPQGFWISSPFSWMPNEVEAPAP